MKLYVINLDRSRDRLEHIKAVFKQLDLPFIRVSAVDGLALSAEELRYRCQNGFVMKELSKTEIGCYLSHLKCLEFIANGDDAFGAVFEDDITLSKYAARFLKDDAWIPKNCDMIKCDTANIVCVLGRFCQTLPQGIKLAPIITKHYGGGGYIISKACAQYFLAHYQVATAPIDEIYFNPLCGFLPKKHILQIMPAIIKHDNETSTIRETLPPEPYIASNRPLWQKILRELQRSFRRYIIPYYRRVFLNSYWGKVPFK